MHVFAWEALTAGLWPEASPSMLREGRAMLAALVEDLLRIDGCRVSTVQGAEAGGRRSEVGTIPDGVSSPTSDLRPPTSGLCSVITCHSADEESAAFEQLTATADVCWIIAPETHGLLAERCRRVEALGGTLAGPSSAAVELCGDKLELARFLESHGVPNIATWPLNPSGVSALLEAAGDGPVVVKPRFGAGSDSIRLLPTLRELAEQPGRLERPGRLIDPQPSTEYICQPFQPGTAASVAVVVRPEEDAIDVLPVCRQLLADDGTFAYLGGEFPVQTERTPEIDRLVRRVCGLIDGLRGYVGFDLIIPDNADEPVLLVEINPRLTTSYVGYRRLTADNLAARAIRTGEPGASATGGERHPVLIHWNVKPLRFFPDGRCIGESGEP
jgi:hypothetical protein